MAFTVEGGLEIEYSLIFSAVAKGMGKGKRDIRTSSKEKKFDEGGGDNRTVPFYFRLGTACVLVRRLEAWLIAARV